MDRFALLGVLFVAAPAFANSWQFGVYLDDKRIGTHRYTIEPGALPDTMRVRSEADFGVKVALVPVFRYRHVAQETWRDGCLVQIETATQVNGRRYALRGQQQGHSFAVDATEDEQRRLETLPECVASYAYWDLRTLRNHSHLLNAQTGAYQPVTQQFLPADAGTPARLQLNGPDFRIDLSYKGENARWLALFTTLGNGRALEYRLENATAAAK